MARMIPLDPAITVPLANGWDLLATEAGRYAAGLTATIALMNGTIQACESIPLADATYREAFAQLVYYRTKVPCADVERKLLDIVTGIEGVLRQHGAKDEDARPSQATRLVTLALNAGAEFFHTPGADGEAYATLEVDGHKETWLLKVKGFRRWLARRFYDEEDKAPGIQAVQDALGVLEGKALYDGPECPVYTRLAEHQGALYLDLGNPQWQAVEITTSGWQVLDTPPVKFRRARGMLPLPVPVTGGTLADLRRFCNLASEADWRLLVSCLLATLRPVGPYPVLVIYGEQGSAKSSLVRVYRALVDPNTAALRTTPRDERDLVIAATNSWLMALDNLSHLPDWLSDALCRLATGSGFATRELYTDAEEAIFAAQRPIVLNGIEELATRGDLLDRAIIVYLPTIPEDKRQDEKAFWQAFEQVRPRILGALLDIVSVGLRTLPGVHLARLPRMADFAVWACAAADACGWTAQDFLDAYQGVREAAYELTLEASPVGPLVHALVEAPGKWEGTASALLAALEAHVHDSLEQKKRSAGSDATRQSDVTKQKAWPRNGRALSNALRRLAPTLRAMGIAVTFDREPGGKRQRIIRLAQVQGTPKAPKERLEPGADEENAGEAAERDREVF